MGTLAALAMVATAIYLLPIYLIQGLTTIPEFLADRFDVTTKTITSGLFLTDYMVVLLTIILYSGSVAMMGVIDIAHLLNLSEPTTLWVCVWSIGITSSIYAIFGGLKAVSVSDSINAIGLLLGEILIPIFVLMAVGEGNITDGTSILLRDNPDKFQSLGGPTSSVPFSTIFTGLMLVQHFYWGTNQQIIQRALGATNLAEGQKSLLLAAFIKILGPIIVVLPGIIAFHLFNGDLDVADEAFPKLVREVLPEQFVGFFGAVMFGAILSSFNSVLNSSVTLFGIDIYKQHIHPFANEITVVRKGKLFGTILAVMAMFIAPFIANAGSLFSYLQEVNGIYSIPILTVFVVGYMTKYVPAIAAKIGIVSGSLLYIISQFILKPICVNRALEKAKISVIENKYKLSEIAISAYPHFLHICAILFVVSVLIMLIIGKLKPAHIPYISDHIKKVDTQPWKFMNPVGISICIIVICVYIFFAQ